MIGSNVCSLLLPYLGSASIDNSINTTALLSLQKPLRELFINLDETTVNENRLILSEEDLLICQTNPKDQEKSQIVYSKLESLIYFQTLRLSKKISIDSSTYEVAFLPIGYDHQDRFHSFFFSNDSNEERAFSNSFSLRPIIVFVIQHPTLQKLSLHVFSLERESTGFDLCDLIRKSTSSHLVPRRIFHVDLNRSNDLEHNRPIKYFERTLSMSSMEFCHRDSPPELKPIVDCPSNVNLVDVNSNTINPSPNPASFLPEHSSSRDHTSQVLTTSNEIHYMSLPLVASPSMKQQRNFVKTSSMIKDESEEILEDLVNIVAVEKLKEEQAMRRRNSTDLYPNSKNGYPSHQKRSFHHKRRSSQCLSPQEPTEKFQTSIIDENHCQRPAIVVNRYADIGNYVPKLLRDNVTMRSSDSNENIFFRSSHGHLLNGFLQLDVSSNKPLKDKIQYQSMININIRPETNIFRAQPQSTNFDMESSKLKIERKNQMKINALSPYYRQQRLNKVQMFIAKPKRIHSFHLGNTEFPTDYRNFLRPTGNSAYLYHCAPPTLETSLGYLP